ncbi:hypothetical protein C8Q78DRAFT_1137627, partial [Trametes maxima]
MPSDATEAALGLLGLTAAFSNSSSTLPSPSSSSTVPAKRKQPPSSSANDDSAGSDTINCICGLTFDDGFSIACDKCGRWCHVACFQIEESHVPDEWKCWVCDPRPVDKERAVKIQRARQRAAANSTNTTKRRASPGVERKPRRPSGVAGEVGHGHTNKRKRRASITAAAHAHQHPEDEHVDIDEPWQQTYVPITKDVVKDDARDRLRRVSSDWRGVTAISPSPTSLAPGCAAPAVLTPDAIPSHPPIALQPLPNASAYPQPFAHGNAPLIAPYPSTIISTAAYLADPLNAYAHLGMPKPFVHLIGPPLDVALDARFTGGQSRFVRSGCRPNAVIRPVLCHAKKSRPPLAEEREDGDGEDTLSFGIFALRDLKPNEEVVLGWEWDDSNVVHHLPALLESPFAFPAHQVQHFRNQMTSMLHALASTFTTCACGAKARDCALARMAAFVEDQAPPTPEPSPPSQFAREKGAARGKKPDHTTEEHASASASAAPVDLGPLIGVERGFRTRERIPFSGGMGGVEMVPPTEEEADVEMEAGPSRARVHAEPQTARRVSFPDDLLSPPVKARRSRKDRKGKARADDGDGDGTEESDGDGGRGRGRARVRRRADTSPDAMDPEERLPPKLRKAWIRQSAQRLHEQQRRLSGSTSKSDDQAEVEDVKMDGPADATFDSREMPPPPVPPSRTPPLSSIQHAGLPRAHAHPHPRSSATPPLPSSTISTSTPSLKPPRPSADGLASPSTPFSKLSLLSPVAPVQSSSTTSPSQPSDSSLARAESPTSSEPAPVSRKRKLTHSRSPQPPPTSEPKESKAPKKAKARVRKDKDKEKDRTKDKGKEKKAARPRTPSTPGPATPTLPTVTELPEEETQVLQPSLVRKEGGAKRKKSTAGAAKALSASASVSPRVVVKEMSSGAPSPVIGVGALPPALSSSLSADAEEVVTAPVAVAGEPSPGAGTATEHVGPSVAPESPKEVGREVTPQPTPSSESVPLPEVVVEDTQMVDDLEEERPQFGRAQPEDVSIEYPVSPVSLPSHLSAAPGPSATEPFPTEPLPAEEAPPESQPPPPPPPP